MVSDIVASFIVGLLANSASQAKQIRKALRKSRTQFIVLGNRACGKTTLINRMLGRPLTSTHSPTVGENSIGGFQYISFDRQVNIKNFSDLPGDPSAWIVWDDVFTRDRPRGIIFMADHEHIKDHLRAFQFFVGFLSKDDKRWHFFRGKHSVAKEKVEVVMLLFNKADEWRNIVNIGYLIDCFAPECNKIEQLGIQIIYHGCSAIEGGADYDNALGDFFRRLLF